MRDDSRYLIENFEISTHLLVAVVGLLGGESLRLFFEEIHPYISVFMGSLMVLQPVSIRCVF